MRILSDDHYRTLFLQAADDWVCDSYSIDIRYVARKDGNQSYLWEASIALAPLPDSQDMSFRIDTYLLSTARYQLCDQPKKKLMQVLESATQGQVDVDGCFFCLSNEQPYDYYSEMIHRDRWYSDLHLQVIGSRSALPAPIDILSIDNALRRSDPPFDGLSDISVQLGLENIHSGSDIPSIKIRVHPPADLIIPECSLQDDQLYLTLHAHLCFDVSRIRLAVRAVPGKGLHSRKQVALKIKWKRSHNGRQVGILDIRVDQADSVLTMLMIGDTTVRRHWFLDSTKASHNRLIAIQHFDKELRMVRKAVLDPSDPERFEKGIAALLFLLSFTPVLQLETDSPDIVVATPGGKLVIVECTMRIADFNAKLGKLVDRRGSLSKALQTSNHYSRVDAVLVCALPKNQIAMRANDLNSHQVILVTKEDLAMAFDQLRFPNDPDEMIDNAVAKFAAGRDAHM